jgi:hypothetical protein
VIYLHNGNTYLEANNNTVDFVGNTGFTTLNIGLNTNAATAYSNVGLGTNRNIYVLKFSTSTGALLNCKTTVNQLLDISNSTAGQIQFPATQNASSNANTLDDYEEGTWTPVDASGAGISLSGASGRYTKIGRQVFLNGAFGVSANSNGSTASIGGLPFTYGSNFVDIGTLLRNDKSLTVSVLGGGSGTSNFNMLNAGTYTSYPTNTQISGGTFTFSFSYAV